MDKLAAVGAPLLVLGGIITYVSIQRLRSDDCCFGEAEPFVALGILIMLAGLEMVLVWVFRLGEYRRPAQVVAGIIGWPLLLAGVLGGAAAAITLSMIDQDDVVESAAGEFVMLAFFAPAFVATLTGLFLVFAARAGSE